MATTTPDKVRISPDTRAKLDRIRESQKPIWGLGATVDVLADFYMEQNRISASAQSQTATRARRRART